MSGCTSLLQWDLSLEYPYSIGLWGGYEENCLWPKRKSGSGDGKTRQAVYQNDLERLFTDGKRNPAIVMDICGTKEIAPSDVWHGMSRFIEARSSLCWDLGVGQFVTFFNLGNGQFYNWKGKRMHDNEWYNTGLYAHLAVLVCYRIAR